MISSTNAKSKGMVNIRVIVDIYARTPIIDIKNMYIIIKINIIQRYFHVFLVRASLKSFRATSTNLFSRVAYVCIIEYIMADIIAVPIIIQNIITP